MAHIHDRIDFTVEVFVVFQNKVLLRKHDKYGIWLSVGGYIELDEDPNQAAIREVKEEVGLDVVLADDLLIKTESTEQYQELIPPKFMNRHRINDTHEHIALTYFAKATSNQIINQEEEKSDDIRWLTVEELGELELKENVRQYAIRALKELA